MSVPPMIKKTYIFCWVFIIVKKSSIMISKGGKNPHSGVFYKGFGWEKVGESVQKVGENISEMGRKGLCQ